MSVWEKIKDFFGGLASKKDALQAKLTKAALAVDGIVAALPAGPTKDKAAEAAAALDAAAEILKLL